MNGKTKTICLQTILTLVMAAGAVAIGFTTFVQAELKDDIQNNSIVIDILTEKVSSVQIQLAEIRGDIKILVERTNP